MAKDRIEIEPFLEGQLSRDQIRRTVKALLSRPRLGAEENRFALHARTLWMEQWAPLLEENWQPPAEPLAEADELYDSALAQAEATALGAAATWETESQRAREAALALAESLEPGASVKSLPRRYRKWMQGPAWVEATLEVSFAQRYRNPRNMDILAHLALQAARELSPEIWGASRVAKCQVHALIEQANAKRVRESFQAAQALLDEARTLLAEIDDPFLNARCDMYEAALAADDRRLGAACGLLESAITAFIDVGETHVAGQAGVMLAAYLLYSGSPGEALATIRDAFARIDPKRDSALADSATQTLISILVKNRQYVEASRLLLSSGLREKWADQPLNLLKLGWLEGQIAAGLGKNERAMAAFEAARAGFSVEDQNYLAALVGLDLAEVLLRQGQTELVRDLAEEMLETFEELGIQREARRALQYLHRACLLEAVTPALVRYVADFLERLEHQPHLRFVEM